MWHSDIGAIVEDEIGKEKWTKCREHADKLYGHAGGLKKNSLHIGASLAFAWDAGKRSDSLERLCTEIPRSRKCRTICEWPTVTWDIIFTKIGRQVHTKL